MRIRGQVGSVLAQETRDDEIMARIIFGLKEGYICPECHREGTRGRFGDGHMANCCSLCLMMIRSAITKWNNRSIVARGELPF